MARSLDAHVALARGDRDAAFEQLEDLVNAPVNVDLLKWDEVTPMGLERLNYARLLGERGEWRRAIEVANVFDSSWPSIFPLYVPASLELRATAAAALGDRRLTARFRDRLERMQNRSPDASQ
ncbi:MAG: hypothetical protein ACREL7_19685 [Longimicrobiales bacterium]